MEALREYVLRICVAGILCSIAVVLAGEKGTAGALCKFVAGLILAVTVAAPLGKLKFADLTDYLDDLQLEAEAYSDAGQTMALEETAGVIKTRVEEYIRDEAALLGIQLQVDVSVLADSTFSVKEVILQGAVSPLNRQKLEQMMAQDLGISKEHLTWKN